MKPLHTANMLGHPVRFFRSPLPGEDLPWHAVDDLHKALGISRALRNEHQARLRAAWGQNIRSITSDGKSVLIAPHWIGQGFTGAFDATQAGAGPDDESDGPMFAAYCKAAKEANDVLLLMMGLTPIEGVSRTIRAVNREAGMSTEHHPGQPDNVMMFVRAEGFYLIEGIADVPLQQQAEQHALLNPGTIRVEAIDGTILWSLQ